MAGQAPASPLLLSLLIMLVLPVMGSTFTGKIATYWGQHAGEGGIGDVCGKKIHNIINIAFLNVFGNDQTAFLNITAHCNPSVGGCTYLASEIKTCQENGIKVMLSLGGGSGSYCLNSTKDAKNVAQYLWENYLGGQSKNQRPFGDAVLDGIDFYIDEAAACSSQHWDALAWFLSEYTSEGKKVYLSAAPKCNYPDAVLADALDTGHFDYVWVRFYNATCQYSGNGTGNTAQVMQSWSKWTSNVSVTSFFLGVPASQKAIPPGGYIPCKEVLKPQIIPAIQNSTNYGGVMLWNWWYDDENQLQYSTCLRNNADLKIWGGDYEAA